MRAVCPDDHEIIQAIRIAAVALPQGALVRLRGEHQAAEAA